MLKAIKAKINRYNAWVLSFAGREEAERALATLAFAESSVFPIPIDPMLIATVSARPEKAAKFVHIVSISSVLGGILGYAIGAFFMGTVGAWIINTLGWQEGFAELGAKYQDNAFWVVLTTALAPIPFKVITISAGAFGISFIAFVLASILRRYARYAAVGLFAKYVGEHHKDKVKYIVEILSIAVLCLVVLVFFGFTWF